MNQQLRDDIANLLLQKTSIEARPYSTYNFGKSKDENCISVRQPVYYYVEYQTLSEVRKLLPEGLVAFVGTDSEELVVGEGQSQMDIIRLARTHAPQINLTTEQIVQRLQQYEDEFEIDLWFAETNALCFNIVGEVKDIPALARDIVQFCPDQLITPGALDYLEVNIAKRRYVHLTWDIEAGC